MLKLSKKADYGLIAVKHLAMHTAKALAALPDIAEAYGVSGPLMAKVLQKLAKGGLVACRGTVRGAGISWRATRADQRIRSDQRD